MSRRRRRQGGLPDTAVREAAHLPERWQDALAGEEAVARGERALRAVFEERRSDLWVEAHGRVTRLLGDDEAGERHQRFVVTLAGGQTVLIAHNLEVAPRVPLALGDRVGFRGLYEWNEQGGVVHWTHHDPFGEREGGYLSWRKRDYR